MLRKYLCFHMTLIWKTWLDATDCLGGGPVIKGKDGRVMCSGVHRSQSNCGPLFRVPTSVQQIECRFFYHIAGLTNQRLPSEICYGGGGSPTKMKSNSFLRSSLFFSACRKLDTGKPKENESALLSLGFHFGPHLTTCTSSRFTYAYL